MSKREAPEPRLFHHLIESHERELSPELRGLVTEFVGQMVEEYKDRKKSCYDLLKRYPDDEGLKQLWTPEYIEAFASGADQPDAVERLRNKPIQEISWHDVSAAVELDKDAAVLGMQAIFNGAEDLIKSGMYAGRAVDCKTPFERAQFSFIRHSFINEWQPRGGIESSLVDMLAQCYVGWQYWLSLTFSVANNIDTVIEQKARNKKSERRSYDEGDWQPPRLTAAEYLERVTQMADRFNRMFLRTLRQMRDLRRYQMPVTINNPKQVNIAADGGQQVNVQGSKKPGKIREKALSEASNDCVKLGKARKVRG